MVDKRGRCETCAKNNRLGTACKVLTHMIGKYHECWAWSDDPAWEIKVKADCENYKLQKELKQ